MIRTILAALAACFALGLAAPASAQDAAPGGRVHIDIDQGHLNPLPIAIPDFLAALLGQNLANKCWNTDWRTNILRNGIANLEGGYVTKSQKDTLIDNEQC